MAQQVVVDIVGDAGKFNATLNASTSSVAKFGAVAGLGGKIASAGFDLVTGAISGVIGGLGDAEAAYKEDEASQSSLQRALDSTNVARSLTVDQIEAQISANQALGTSDSAQRDGIRDFIDLTNSDTEAMQLNTAAIELAAAKGITYEEAVAKIKSGVQGKTAALAKDGIAVEKGSSATEIATAILDKYAGSQERVAATAEGRTTIANEKMGEAMEKVGGIVNQISQIVFPALATALTFLTDTVIPPVQDAMKFIGDNLNVVIPIVAVFAAGIATFLVPAFIAWATAAGAAAIATLAAAAPVIAAAAPFIALGAAIAGVILILNQLGVIDWITKNLLPPLVAGLQVVAGVVSGAFGTAFKWVTDTVLPPLVALFNNIAKTVLPVLQGAMEFISKNVIPALGSAFGFITKNVLPPLTNILKTLIDVGLLPVRIAMNILTNGVLPVLGNAFNWISKTILPPLSTAFNAVVKTVLPPVQAALEFLSKKVLPALGTAFEGIKTTVGKVFGAVTGVIKGSLNTVIGVVNAMIRGINKIQVHIGRIGLDVPGVGFVGVGPFDWSGLNMSYLPQLHTGGIVPGPEGSDVLALLQAGERVIPRTQAQGGTTVVVNIENFTGSDSDIDRLADRLARRMRLAGA